MPEQAQVQTAPAASEATLHPAETIAAFRSLLDGLEEILSPETDPNVAARKAGTLAQAEPQKSPAPSQAGTDLVSDLAVTDGLVEAAGTVAPRGESSLRSSRLWTTICGIGALAGGQFAGLPPITQVCITALAGIYIITRAMTHGGR